MRAQKVINPRIKFLHEFCKVCSQPQDRNGCAIAFRQAFQPIQCPKELVHTHDVCSFCLDLYQISGAHKRYCLFNKQSLKLHSAGWATPASNEVRRSLRLPASPYRIPLINIIQALFAQIGAENWVIVPIPMASPGRGDRWLKLATDAIIDIKGARIIQALKRERIESTRKSVAQMRLRIAQREYLKNPLIGDELCGQKVILLDDNVTTGATMLHCASVLTQFGISDLKLVSLDRTLSPRGLQRCPSPASLNCSYYSAILKTI